LQLEQAVASDLDLVKPLPYKIATLLYCFNDRDDVLLMERAQDPNLGLWSPCGGKLHTEEGESPYRCACREADEELGLIISATDLHLTGIVSEHGYGGQTHWLIFLFEVKLKLATLPVDHREGRFQFFSRQELTGLKLPQTDLEQIWPWFWQHRGGYFSAHCRCGEHGANQWTLEESIIPAAEHEAI
jgi:8-oxo-dGTP diphosphatase